MTAQLCKTGWLFREWKVVTPAGEHIVSYDGRGFGYESVRVDGRVAVKTRSLLLCVPRFEFRIGELPASVDVRVWLWCTVRAIRLNVAGEVCYREGFKDDRGHA